MRIGMGFDLHKMVKGRPLVLGGIRIPYEKGLAGHSDADVILHALTDAILGAAGLPDIGNLFPDQDPAFKDRESTFFVKEAIRLALEKGLCPWQVDIVLVLEQPRIAPWREAIKENLAALLNISSERVGFKAKTTEGLGFWGEEAAAAWATVVLKENAA